MRYALIKKNDIVDCTSGICVSFWTQGCPHRCPGCHNPEQFDFNGGIERPVEGIISEIISDIKENNIPRNFSILGGEPLCEQNKKDVLKIIWDVRHDFPNIEICLWTGYVYEDLLRQNDIVINNILANIDILIDGPYIAAERDITLPMRGSRNQRIINLKK